VADGAERSWRAAVPVATEFLFALALPGWTMRHRARTFAAVVFVAGVVVPLTIVVWIAIRWSGLLDAVLDERVQLTVLAVIVAVVATRAVAIGEVAWRRRAGPGGRVVAIVAMAMVVALVVPASATAMRVADARSGLDAVFGTVDDGPVFDLATVVESPPPPSVAATPAPETTSPTPTVPSHGRSRVVRDVAVPLSTTTSSTLPPIDKSLLKGVRNVLLLGGDAGPGRWNLRTDTMILVSIDEASGRAALISIPRNLERLRFPPGTPLADRHPSGFDDLANAVYPRAATSGALSAYYGRSGRDPGMVAVAQGVGYSLGVSIDDVVLVNMQGFADLVDAIGGVTVEIPGVLPMPGNVPGAAHELPASLGPGVIRLDGTLALGYVRSRSADSDYQRMGRQRVLLAALGAQVSLSDVALRFTEITGALGTAIRTSMTADEFTALVELFGDSTSIVASVGLTPPLIRPNRPNYDRIDRIVAEVQLALVTGEPSPY
jgi:LCP family protein required for cell wall assembly